MFNKNEVRLWATRFNFQELVEWLDTLNDTQYTKAIREGLHC